MSSKEEWNASEEEFREEENVAMQEEEYDEDVQLGDDLDAEEYDEAQYSGDQAQDDFDDELEYEDELKHDEDDGDDRAVAEYDDDDEDLDLDDSSEDSPRKDGVDEYYMRRQRDLSRQLEEDRRTSHFQQKLCSVVLCLTIVTTLWLTFWIPNRILVDTSEFSIHGITPSITDNGRDEYEVSFRPLGELMFTNHNAPLVRMVVTGFSLQARFLCDSTASDSPSMPLCESIENGTTVSPFYAMSTFERGTVIHDDDGQKHYELRIPKAIASSPDIRDIMAASCDQNKNFRVEFRAEAEILHEFSFGFSLPITDIPVHTFACVEPNQGDGLFNWS